MPRFVNPHPVLCLVLWLGHLPSGSARPDEPTLSTVWRQVASYLGKDALVSLDRLPDTGDAAQLREREFCRAVVELDQQPLTDDRLDRVEQRLRTLRAAGTDDAIAHASLYLLGRIAQVFRAEPDNRQAAALYRELIASAAGDHWADLARIKLAMLELYVLPAASPAERIAAVESLIPGGTEPVTLRDLHRLAARGLMFYNLSPASALQHLLAADAIGGLRGTPAADQVVQIGELAWELGRRDLAQTYRERLREEFPRDPRIYLVDQRFAGRPVPQRSPSSP